MNLKLFHLEKRLYTIRQKKNHFQAETFHYFHKK